MVREAFSKGDTSQMYRTQDKLAKSVLDFIYNEMNALTLIQKNTPRPFLKLYLGHMPLSVAAGNIVYELSFFVHFANVSWDQQEILSSGSCRNLAVCVAILKALFSTGLTVNKTAKFKTVGVMTVYSSQVTALQHRFQAEARGGETMFEKVHIVTPDEVQGVEFNLCLVSLVSTQGSRGVLGEMEKANVVATRPREVALYVGNWQYWDSPNNTGLRWMDKILYSYRKAFPRTFVINGRPI
ncbi:MAG: hypothetical protein Q9222_000086 [Ikaeria aurantiellina]